MIEPITRNERWRRYFPPIAGFVLACVFVGLGFWQLERAAEKKRLLEQFAATADYLALSGPLPDRPFTPVSASGRYQPDRQILIDNIVRDGRVGHYVVTPLEQPGTLPLVLVNRGWLARDDGADLPTVLDVSTDARTVRGKSGGLPRVSIRAGDGFAGAVEWPRHATYPTLEEVERELGEPVLPVVLLLDANEPDGFLREWQPRQSGPMTNYSYAFQWFAMAVAVLAIIAWRLRQRTVSQ